MKRAKKAKKAAATILPDSVLHTLHVARIRLIRANDVLNAIDHMSCHGSGEVNLGALAVAARDLIDRVLEDVAMLGCVEEDDEGAC